MTSTIQGFLLGLANGGSCLIACAPILLPYIISEGSSVRRNTIPVIYFLSGRLAGYLIFAVFTWEAGKWIRSAPRSGIIFGIVYGLLAFMLVLYGFGTQANACAAKGIQGKFLSLNSRWPAMIPAAMGLLTGLSLCPPFIAAIAGATASGSLPSTLLYFFSFFLATSLYVIPFPFVGLIGRFAAIRIVGRLAAGVMGCFLFYQSLILIYGGLRP
jgi:hypothetical protein